MIPAEAVEAAAKAMAELGEFDNGECEWPDFAVVGIAAAAPHMLAACWADAYEKGRERGEWEAAPVTKEPTHTNPYRPALE